MPISYMEILFNFIFVVNDYISVYIPLISSSLSFKFFSDSIIKKGFFSIKSVVDLVSIRFSLKFASLYMSIIQFLISQTKISGYGLGDISKTQLSVNG